MPFDLDKDENLILTAQGFLDEIRKGRFGAITGLIRFVKNKYQDNDSDLKSLILDELKHTNVQEKDYQILTELYLYIQNNHNSGHSIINTEFMNNIRLLIDLSVKTICAKNSTITNARQIKDRLSQELDPELIEQFATFVSTKLSIYLYNVQHYLDRFRQNDFQAIFDLNNLINEVYLNLFGFKKYIIAADDAIPLLIFLMLQTDLNPDDLKKFGSIMQRIHSYENAANLSGIHSLVLTKFEAALTYILQLPNNRELTKPLSQATLDDIDNIPTVTTVEDESSILPDEDSLDTDTKHAIDKFVFFNMSNLKTYIIEYTRPANTFLSTLGLPNLAYGLKKALESENQQVKALAEGITAELKNYIQNHTPVSLNNLIQEAHNLYGNCKDEPSKRIGQQLIILIDPTLAPLKMAINSLEKLKKHATTLISKRSETVAGKKVQQIADAFTIALDNYIKSQHTLDDIRKFNLFIHNNRQTIKELNKYRGIKQYLQNICLAIAMCFVGYVIAWLIRSDKLFYKTESATLVDEITRSLEQLKPAPSEVDFTTGATINPLNKLKTFIDKQLKIIEEFNFDYETLRKMNGILGMDKPESDKIAELQIIYDEYVKQDGNQTIALGLATFFKPKATLPSSNGAPPKATPI